MVSYVKKRGVARARPRKKAKKVVRKKSTKKKVEPVLKKRKRKVVPKRASKKPAIRKRVLSKKPKVAKSKKTIGPARKTVSKKPSRKTVAKKSIKGLRKTPAKKEVRKKARKPSSVSRRLREAEVRAEQAETRLQEALDRLSKLEARLEKERVLEEERERHRILSREEQERMLRQRQDLFHQQVGKIIELAKRTNQLRSGTQGRSTIDTGERSGERMTIQVEEMLRPETLTRIMANIRASTRWMENIVLPLWLGEITLAGLGEKLVGYGATTLRTSDPVAQWFQTEGVESTGLQSNYEDTLARLHEILERLANDESTLVYINYVSVSTFLHRK